MFSPVYNAFLQLNIFYRDQMNKRIEIVSTYLKEIKYLEVTMETINEMKSELDDSLIKNDERMSYGEKEYILHQNEIKRVEYEEHAKEIADRLDYLNSVSDDVIIMIKELECYERLLNENAKVLSQMC